MFWSTDVQWLSGLLFFWYAETKLEPEREREHAPSSHRSPRTHDHFVLLLPTVDAFLCRSDRCRVLRLDGILSKIWSGKSHKLKTEIIWLPWAPTAEGILQTSSVSYVNKVSRLPVRDRLKAQKVLRFRKLKLAWDRPQFYPYAWIQFVL